MPRARRITPEFWLNGELATLKDRTKLLYIGLWNFADCNGIIEYDTNKIRVQIFPYQKIDIKNNLESLIKLKKLIPYEVADKKYLWIRNFVKFQHLKKPYYQYPLPPNPVRQQYPTGEVLVTPQSLKKQKQKQKQKQKPNKEENSISSFKKPYYKKTGEEMRFFQGRWWVIPKLGGQWLEFAGEKKDIKYNKGQSNLN